MKKLLSLFFAISLTLSACRTVSTQPIPPTQTGTPTVTPTVTQTPTSSITPLPTIPTFTPTFDVSTIVTVTPAERAECSEAQYKELMNGQSQNQSFPLLIDVTNDGISDVYFEDRFIQTLNGSRRVISVYICIKNEYEEFRLGGADSPLHPSYTNPIHDLNNNGIPEIIVINDECWGMGRCQRPIIFEWNSKEFVDLSYKYPYNISWGDLSLSFEDLDKNGTTEILYHEGAFQSGDTRANGPFRPYTEIYSWNGKEFAPILIEMNRPTFRFQAVNDADKMSIIGRYDKALSLYEEAINSKTLRPYSFELRFYYREQFMKTYDIASIPTPDYEIPEYPAEYPSLAAYAYYRIMLLHLVQGQDAEAESAYQTLQDTFGSDSYAAPYIEMSNAFWKAYQSTHKMYDGCAAAIQYAVEHPEILIPLGSDYHGWQSHTYMPADVCPFR